MTEPLRSHLATIAGRHSWDGAAIYALASLLTAGTFRPDARVERWTPERTRVGLFGLGETQARLLGVKPSPHPPKRQLAAVGGAWASWTVAAMSAEDQCALFEAHLERAFARRAPRRPVDYYLAALDAAPGLPDGTAVLADGIRMPIEALNGQLRAELKRTSESETGPLWEVLWTLGVLTLTGGRIFR